jgi:hypothetical protein
MVVLVLHFFLLLGQQQHHPHHAFTTHGFHISSTCTMPLLNHHYHHHHHIASFKKMMITTADDDNDDFLIHVNDSETSQNSSILRHAALNIPLPQKAPFLTTMEQKRREIEQLLLKQLLHGDEVISQFKKLWFSERGPDVEKIMYQAEMGIGLGPTKWNETCEVLEALIRQDPTYIEPFVRLSKLYCLQGRLVESKMICQQVLSLKFKPWHFVALETMVAIHTALLQENDDDFVQEEEVQHWSSRRLPRPDKKEERKQWVERALENAHHQLEQSREDARHSEFNVPRQREGDGQDDNMWQ